jgi:tetratricopeptide (TPR) repeat protein
VAPGNSRSLFLTQPDRELARHPLSDRVLYRKNVCELLRILLGPQLDSGSRIEEPRGDPHPLSDSLDASVQHGIDAELAPRYAHLLSNSGRHDEALREVDRALSFDRHSPLANALKVQFLFHGRRYPEAIRELEKNLEREPGFWISLIQLARSHEREGAYDEALRVLSQARELTGSSIVPSMQGYTLARAGRTREAEEILRELEYRREERYVPPYNLALVHHGLGDTAATIRLLNQAYVERDVRLVFLGVDPVWDGLRQDAGFVDLLARLRF